MATPASVSILKQHLENSETASVHVTDVAHDSCAHCGKPATKRCKRCQFVRYCNQQCQLDHWRAAHRKECSPHLIQEQEEIKRNTAILKKPMERLLGSGGAMLQMLTYLEICFSDTPFDKPLIPMLRFKQDVANWDAPVTCDLFIVSAEHVPLEIVPEVKAIRSKFQKHSINMIHIPLVIARPLTEDPGMLCYGWSPITSNIGHITGKSQPLVADQDHDEEDAITCEMFGQFMDKRLLQQTLVLLMGMNRGHYITFEINNSTNAISVQVHRDAGAAVVAVAVAAQPKGAK